MNERIRQLAELAEQADEYAKQTVHYYMELRNLKNWQQLKLLLVTALSNMFLAQKSSPS